MEPKVAMRVLQEMMARYPNLKVRLQTKVTKVEVEGDKIARLQAVGPNNEPLTFEAPMILDATDLGDLLPMANVEHVIGAESREQTGEPDAPEKPQPKV